MGRRLIMKIKSNIKDLIDQLQNVTANGRRIDFSEPLAVGVNAARAAMQYRIFNTGTDAAGESLGKYIGRTYRTTSRKYTYTLEDIFDSETKKKLGKKRKQLLGHSQFNPELKNTDYEKLRLSEGRQIGFKDLEFYGSLRRAIVTVTNDNNKVSCVIDNELEYNISVWQEQQIASIREVGYVKKTDQRAPIFQLAKDEQELLETEVNTALKILYDSLFNFK